MWQVRPFPRCRVQFWWVTLEEEEITAPPSLSSVMLYRRTLSTYVPPIPVHTGSTGAEKQSEKQNLLGNTWNSNVSGVSSNNIVATHTESSAPTEVFQMWQKQRFVSHRTHFYYQLQKGVHCPPVTDNDNSDLFFFFGISCCFYPFLHFLKSLLLNSVWNLPPGDIKASVLLHSNY